MRLRNVKGAREALANNEKVFEDAENYKGIWNNQVFGNNNPIHVEIGMGKGQFIRKLASNNSNINYIGFEKYSSVIVRAAEKLNEVENDNLVLVRMDAEKINDVFIEGEIDRIYLNFSDPWPKERHAKRRLTHKYFLDRYKEILSENGEIHFKTDNKTLFKFSVEQFQANNWELKNVSYNLHIEKNYELLNNVMTEYEEKFVKLNYPIYRLEAFYPFLNIKKTL